MFASTLRPVALPAHLIGRPAPCDIFDAKGTLLQSVGSPIAWRADRALHPPRIFCEASQADHISSANPIAQLRAAGQALAHLDVQIDCGGPVASADVLDLAREVHDLWHLDADACIGYARLIHFDRPSVGHAVLSALLAAELAAATGGTRQSIMDIIGAALTMNLGSMALHDRMFEMPDVPGHRVSANVCVHPIDAAGLLERIGGIPSDWVAAVAQHHENVDGSGYPCGLKRANITLPARMLRIADTLAAKMMGRKTRPPQHWNIQQTRDVPHLIQHVFGADLKRLDQLLVRQLMTRLSAFPPGSLVRLSSGELAVVNRRRSDRNAPPREAMVFIGTHGRLLEAPRARRIGTRDCRIHSYVEDELPKLPHYDWQRIWGYA
jgi:HD-GYP domain-containing protein (c-di-GMP phosphodiesterase class II)